MTSTSSFLAVALAITMAAVLLGGNESHAARPLAAGAVKDDLPVPLPPLPEVPGLPLPPVGDLPVPKVPLPPLPEVPKMLPPLPEVPGVPIPPVPEVPGVPLPPLPSAVP